MKKKLLLFTMYFDPEPVGIGPMATGLADYLAEHGWDVTVVTAVPKLPQWEIYPDYRGRLLVRENRAGIAIQRTWIYVPPRARGGLMPAWQRVLFDSTVALGAIPATLSLPHQDLIVSITPPLQLAAAAIALKKLWRCPLLNWIQDIVPDAAMNVGMMHEGKIVQLARRLENFIYTHSDLIGVISEGFRANLLTKGVPPEKIVLLSNWSIASAFETPVDRVAVRAAHGIGPDDFLMIHAGSISAKQVLENVIRGMKLLDADPSFHLLMLGDGNRREAVQHEAESLGAPRIRFLGTVSNRDHADLLRSADLLILNQLHNLIDALVPSKLLTYLPSGIPVLAAVHPESEAARFIHDAGCGVVIEAENPRAFADAVIALKTQPEMRTRMGAAGKKYVIEFYSKQPLLARFDAALHGLLN